MKIMNKALYFLFVFIVLSCGSDDNDVDENCNFLLNIAVNETINLSLPQYSPLQFPNNPVYLPNSGNGGIIVNNIGSGYVAFDAADPNHAPSACSVLEITGITAVCGCPDENEYNLINGLPENNTTLRCSLKAYRVESNGNNLIIFN